MPSPDTNKHRDRDAFKLHPASSGSGDDSDRSKLTYGVHDRHELGGSDSNVVERLRSALARALTRCLDQITAADDSVLPMRIGSRRIGSRKR
jgi:hypothetical protein